jgi:hypothetical protein
MGTSKKVYPLTNSKLFGPVVFVSKNFKGLEIPHQYDPLMNLPQNSATLNAHGSASRKSGADFN